LDPGPSWLVWLAIAGVLNSALSLYYYARVIKFMYMDKGPAEKFRPPPMITAAVAIAVIMTVILGVGFEPVVDALLEMAGDLFRALPLGT